jgi:hypothetical protein
MNTPAPSQIPSSSMPKWRLLVGIAGVLLLLSLVVANLAAIITFTWNMLLEARDIATIALLWTLSLVAVALLGTMSWDRYLVKTAVGPATRIPRAPLVLRVFSGVLALGAITGASVEIQHIHRAGLSLTVDGAFLAFLVVSMPIGAAAFSWIAIRGNLPAWFNQQSAAKSPDL